MEYGGRSPSAGTGATPPNEPNPSQTSHARKTAFATNQHARIATTTSAAKLGVASAALAIDSAMIKRAVHCPDVITVRAEKMISGPAGGCLLTPTHPKRQKQPRRRKSQFPNPQSLTLGILASQELGGPILEEQRQYSRFTSARQERVNQNESLLQSTIGCKKGALPKRKPSAPRAKWVEAMKHRTNLTDSIL